MNFSTIKRKDSGFTIVELLIVVVVIAILAAITIVSYNGITNRANAAAADSLVATWRKKVEAFNAEEGRYPRLVSQMNAPAKSYYITDSSLTANDNPDPDNGKTLVFVQACSAGTAAAPTTDSAVSGIKISYWDYDASSPAVASVNVGNVGTNCATGFND